MHLVFGFRHLWRMEVWSLQFKELVEVYLVELYLNVEFGCRGVCFLVGESLGV